MKHVFIINPAAGKQDSTVEVAAAIRAVCVERGLDYDILTTEYPRHAVELVKKKAVEYCGQAIRFYACGGDGTLNEVAAGAAGLANVSITHYPCGSGNDFIKLFGADCQSFKKLENLIDGKDVALDYIESDCGVCINVFSVGLDARIASGMPSTSGSRCCTAPWPITPPPWNTLCVVCMSPMGWRSTAFPMTAAIR